MKCFFLKISLKLVDDVDIFDKGKGIFRITPVMIDIKLKAVETCKKHGEVYKNSPYLRKLKNLSHDGTI